MSPRLPILVGTLVAVVMISLPVAAQQERTAWGDPDLQGIWSVELLVPLERPAGVTKEFYTEAEVAALEVAEELVDDPANVQSALHQLLIARAQRRPELLELIERRAAAQLEDGVLGRPRDDHLGDGLLQLLGGGLAGVAGEGGVDLAGLQRGHARAALLDDDELHNKKK